jgi:hypothetical protein
VLFTVQPKTQAAFELTACLLSDCSTLGSVE